MGVYGLEGLDANSFWHHHVFFLFVFGAIWINNTLWGACVLRWLIWFLKILFNHTDNSRYLCHGAFTCNKVKNYTVMQTPSVGKNKSSVSGLKAVIWRRRRMHTFHALLHILHTHKHTLINIFSFTFPGFAYLNLCWLIWVCCCSTLRRHGTIRELACAETDLVMPLMQT